MTESEKAQRRADAGVADLEIPEVTLESTARPASSISPKVSGGLAAGACATVIVFVASQFGLEIPPGVEGAVAVLIGFAAGYLVPDNR